MTKRVFCISATILVLGCSNSIQNNNDLIKGSIDTNSVVISQLPSLSGINDVNHPTIRKDTLTFPITVSQFLNLNHHNQLATNKLLIRKDTLFESSYVPGDSVQWVFYRYQNSEIIRLGDSTLLSINIKDNELLKGSFIQIGMSYHEFKALFTDFDTLLNKDYEEGTPQVLEDNRHFWIRNTGMEYTGWLVGFSNDSLYLLSHNIYYEF